MGLLQGTQTHLPEAGGGDPSDDLVGETGESNLQDLELGRQPHSAVTMETAT